MYVEPALDYLRGVSLDRSWTEVILFVVSAAFISQVILFFYRLTLHPLARFPGPKLAAATYWYEYYYDVSKKGRYLWKIKELHQQYGTIAFCLPLIAAPSDEQAR
jgi:hypothetical protein